MKSAANQPINILPKCHVARYNNHSFAKTDRSEVTTSGRFRATTSGLGSLLPEVMMTITLPAVRSFNRLLPRARSHLVRNCLDFASL
jgi:hypothetical protein